MIILKMPILPIFLIFFPSFTITATLSAEEWLPLITVEESFEHSRLVGLTAERKLRFLLDGGEEKVVLLEKLVRFGNSVDPDPGKVWILDKNGSLFVDTLEEHQKHDLFKSDLERICSLNEYPERIAAVILRPPVDPKLGDLWQQDDFLSPGAEKKPSDSPEVGFLLSNGDTFWGRLLEFSRNEAICEFEGRKLILPARRIRMVKFQNQEKLPQHQPVKYVVSLNNGSRLRLVGLEIGPKSYSGVIVGKISGRTEPINIPIAEIRELVVVSGEFDYISDKLQPAEASTEVGIAVNRSFEGAFLRIVEQRFEKGIAIISSHRMSYEHDGRAGKIVGLVGIGENLGKETFLDKGDSSTKSEVEKWRFRVFVDGKCVFETDSVIFGERPRPFSINIDGGKRLEFLAELNADNHPENAGLSKSQHHAVWAELRIQ